jgi:hypothetical protein
MAFLYGFMAAPIGRDPHRRDRSRIWITGWQDASHFGNLLEVGDDFGFTNYERREKG